MLFTKIFYEYLNFFLWNLIFKRRKGKQTFVQHSLFFYAIELTRRKKHDCKYKAYKNIVYIM